MNETKLVRKSNWKKLMKSKLFIVLSAITLIVMCATSVFAIWFLSYNKIIIGEVAGEEGPLRVSLDFEDSFLINVTNESKVYSDSMRLYTFGSAINMTTNLNVIKTNLTQNCDYENDCNVELFKNGLELINGTNFTLTSVTSYFELNVSCVKGSCNQEIEIQIELIED